MREQRGGGGEREQRGDSEAPVCSATAASAIGASAPKFCRASAMAPDRIWPSRSHNEREKVTSVVTTSVQPASAVASPSPSSSGAIRHLQSTVYVSPYGASFI